MKREKSKEKILTIDELMQQKHKEIIIKLDILIEQMKIRNGRYNKKENIL